MSPRSGLATIVDIVRMGVLALLVAQTIGGTALGAGISRASPLIDPEVRAQVSAGRARVLVMLRVTETDDQGRRADAIGRAQDTVLARLSQLHASVVRRYASVPMLALEIDATALRALETMSDVVAGVKLDRAVKTQ